MKTFFTACLATLALSAQVAVAQSVPEDVEPEVRVQNVPSDQAIQDRLRAVVRAIAGMKDVELSVQAGVVTLEGEVSSARSGRELMALASRVEGVIFVQNRLMEQVDLSARLTPARQKLEDLTVTFIRTLPFTLAALTVVVVFAFLGRWASHRAGGRPDRGGRGGGYLGGFCVPQYC